MIERKAAGVTVQNVTGTFFGTAPKLPSVDLLQSL
jgi:hypothetical protein